jgi:hypothetical protein
MSETSSGAGCPRLTILTPPLQGRSFILTGPVATIGRSPDCEIILDQASISRQHARITEENGHFVLRDLDSRNGITVGGQPVRESLLENGDQFSVGDIQMRFEIIGAPAPGGDPPRGGQPTAVAASRAMPAIPAGWQPVTPGARPAAPEPAQRGAAKLNVKLLIAAAVGLLLAIGIGVLILGRNGEKSAGVVQLATMLIQVGENRWLPRTQLPVGFKQPIVLGEIAGFTATPDNIVEVAKAPDPGELIVTGVSGGEADVQIVTVSGNTAMMRVLVRGRMENSLEELIYAPLGEGERRARAHYFVESGRALQKERPYLAQQQYERALAVLSKLTIGEDYLAATRGLDEAKKAVDEQWDKLVGEIRVALNNNDLKRAEQLLQEALKLVPDENDWRSQKALSQLQSVLWAQMPKKK